MSHASYVISYNAAGGPVAGGPRDAGPHQNVWDYFGTPEGSRHPTSPARVRCHDCDAEWPEGSECLPACVRADAGHPRVAVLSVESTGTHFTAAVCARLLGCTAGWATAEKKHPIQMAHVYPPGFETTDLVPRLVAQADRIVVPLRHPVMALLSNARRGRRALPFRTHAEAFRRIAGWRGIPGVYFFRVDPPQGSRQLEAAALAAFLGTEPQEIPWTPLNVASHPLDSYHCLERTKDWRGLNVFLDGALELLTKQREFFARFGYRTDWCISQ